MSKQDYIMHCLEKKQIVVVGNPKVYKALKNELGSVLDELHRIETSDTISQDLLDTIKLITITMQGMKSGE